MIFMFRTSFTVGIPEVLIRFYQSEESMLHGIEEKNLLARAVES